MSEGGLPVQFCPWVHLSQRWKVLERELQQGSLQPKEHGTERPLCQTSSTKLPEGRPSSKIPEEPQSKSESSKASENVPAWALASTSQEQKPQSSLSYKSVQSLPPSEQEPQSLPSSKQKSESTTLSLSKQKQKQVLAPQQES